MSRGRGGKRDGAVGKNYANRTDLQGQNVVSAQPQNQPGVKLANATATGQPYGAATAQENAMKAVPIVNTGTPTQATPAQSAPEQSAPVTRLDAPGDPNQSLFHGMDNVAGGAGSEAMLAVTPPSPAAQALTLLNTLGDNVSPQVQYIRTFLAHQAQNQAPK
jgi:hypothetical protein